MGRSYAHGRHSIVSDPYLHLRLTALRVAQDGRMSNLTTRPRGRRLRAGRHAAPGGIYLVTTITQHRHPLFLELGSARLLIGVLHAPNVDATTHAYVVMPDHLHWLVQLGNRHDLAGLLTRVKSHSSRLLNARLGRRGRVWQAGYHDHALRSEESLVEIARYIVMNPVRAGLVDSPWAYPHWDAAWVKGP